MSRRPFYGRTEFQKPAETPDFNKLPALREAITKAGLTEVAQQVVGCTTHDLKPFAKGAVSKLPSGLRGRVIDVLTLGMNE